MAESLNKLRPDVYKDPNPKPELAIAISNDFEALFGFTSQEEMGAQFSENPPL